MQKRRVSPAFPFPSVVTIHWISVNEGLDWLSSGRISFFRMYGFFPTIFVRSQGSISIFMSTDWACRTGGAVYVSWLCHLEFSVYISWVCHAVGVSVHHLGLLYCRALCTLYAPWTCHMGHSLDILLGYVPWLATSCGGFCACWLGMS